MPTKLRVVVSCSDRKSLPAAPDLRLAQYRADTLLDRSGSWINRINRPQSETRPANALYQGAHWSVVRNLNDENPSCIGTEVELWIASAGYGLTRWDEELESYGATFSSGHADSVVAPGMTDDRAGATAFWWDALASRHRIDDAPPSLAELVSGEPDSPVLVALSASYLRAVRHDLGRALRRTASPQNLFILSTGSSSIELGGALVPFDSRLLGTVGGSNMSLIPRTARFLVAHDNQHGWDFDEVRNFMNAQLEQQPARPSHDRDRQSDAQVMEVIRGALAEADSRQTKRPSATTLLRLLRDSGNACEQKRFKDLYDRVSGDRESHALEGVNA